MPRGLAKRLLQSHQQCMARLLPKPARFFVTAVAFEGALLVIGLAIGWFISPHPAAAAGWSAEAVLLGIVWTLPLLVALVFLRSVRQGSIQQLNRTIDELLTPLFKGLAIWQFAVIAALAGLGEELLFRGILQPLLTQAVGVGLAIAVTSVIFGLAHWITPIYGVLAALVSVYFGWLFVRYENLAIPMMAHGLYDFVALMYLVRSERQPQQA